MVFQLKPWSLTMGYVYRKTELQAHYSQEPVENGTWHGTGSMYIATTEWYEFIRRKRREKES